MIQVPTVLILGAGASMPYDFPSGYGLLKAVCDQLGPSGHDDRKQMLRELGYSHYGMDEFRESLLRSGQRSVDAFLEQRPAFIDIGKAAIAVTLIPYEDDEALTDRRLGPNSWYEYLRSQIGATWKDFGKNLAVITYNYDRSLEWYLFNCLKHSFNRSDTDCSEKLFEIPILHVHGLLGELSIPGVTAGRPYDSHLDAASVRLAARGIRIVHENIEEYPIFHDAKQRLLDAKVICFLGFGYHSLNLQRLEISRLRSNRTVCGTILGLKHAEVLQLNKDIGHSLDILCDVDILDFLRQTAIFSIGS